MSQNIVEIAKLARKRDAQIDAELDGLLTHEGKWPHYVLYWARYFDPWLMRVAYWEPQHLQGVRFKRTRDDSSTLLSVSPRQVAKAGIKPLLSRRKFQYSETRWYLWHLQEAASAFSEFNDISIIYVRITPVSASDGDEHYRAVLRDVKPN